jgi:hypothetical protein
MSSNCALCRFGFRTIAPARVLSFMLAVVTIVVIAASPSPLASPMTYVFSNASATLGTDVYNITGSFVIDPSPLTPPPQLVSASITLTGPPGGLFNATYAAPPGNQPIDPTDPMMIDILNNSPTCNPFCLVISFSTLLLTPPSPLSNVTIDPSFSGSGQNLRDRGHLSEVCRPTIRLGAKRGSRA